jgi:anionic cell wall polymer biosynthesis LytR-Cps2A-Psr (LCP) family protein
MKTKTKIALGTVLCLVVVALLMSNVNAYNCINEEDNDAVKEFKSKMNVESINYDLNKGVKQEAILLKIKYFSGCS